MRGLPISLVTRILMEDFCLGVPEAVEWMRIQTCDPNPCNPVPTREDTWGKVKIEFDTSGGLEK